MSSTIQTYVTAPLMKVTFTQKLLKHQFSEQQAQLCAEVFTSNSIDGVYTHGVNRFPRFIEYVQKGFVKPLAVAALKHRFGAVEQWEGNLAAGVLNAIAATDRAMQLCADNGIGCVALANTNHWMRGGYYGWQAAKAGFILLAWTNTTGIMPAWNAMDSKLGNNPFVMAVPYNHEAIVLDMAMSQFSYGAMELAAMQQRTLQVPGGYDANGNLTDDPNKVLESKRSLPIGYWKGAGLAFLLDVLATVLSGGLSTKDITSQQSEHAVSQVFIAIDPSKLHHSSAINATIQGIVDDYHRSLPISQQHTITYPGERVLATRHRNLQDGIPVLQSIWNTILNL